MAPDQWNKVCVMNNHHSYDDWKKKPDDEYYWKKTNKNDLFETKEYTGHFE